MGNLIVCCDGTWNTPGDKEGVVYIVMPFIAGFSDGTARVRPTMSRGMNALTHTLTVLMRLSQTSSASNDTDVTISRDTPRFVARLTGVALSTRYWSGGAPTAEMRPFAVFQRGSRPNIDLINRRT